MLSIASSSLADLAKMQSQLLSAKQAVTGDGLESTITLGLIQLHRFVLANIEVDTARTKNSIFMKVERQDGDVIGRLGSQVKYSPWVRDAGHKMQFFEYARKNEGPKVLEMMGREVTLSVKGAFS